MPALLRQLHGIVPCAGATFFFSDARGRLVGIYDENPESARVVPVYLEEFHDRADLEVTPSFTHSMLYEWGVTPPEKAFTADRETVLRSPAFNRLLKPLGYESLARLVVHGLDGTPMGCLNVYRAPGGAVFTPEELRRLASLESYLVHALLATPQPDLPLVESGEVGILVADFQGRLKFASNEGRRLLALATGPGLPPPASDPRLDELPPPLVRLCRALETILAGQAWADPPLHRCRNAWGGFTFRGQLLGAPASPPQLVAIIVTHKEPLPLRLVRGLDKFELSPRQGEVCLLLAMGLSYQEIADRLGIAKGTAITHGRWVHERLAATSRADLLHVLID